MASVPPRPASGPLTVLLDTDVLVNWLVKEVESVTHRPLWPAPHRIIARIERRQLRGATSLTTLLELRYLLRRKRVIDRQEVASVITDLTTLLEIVIPDEISLLEANRLQAEHPLDPFDAIALGIALTLRPAALISRDAELLRMASHYLPALTPEAFEASYFPPSSASLS